MSKYVIFFNSEVDGVKLHGPLQVKTDEGIAIFVFTNYELAIRINSDMHLAGGSILSVQELIDSGKLNKSVNKAVLINDPSELQPNKNNPSNHDFKNRLINILDLI